MLIVVVYVAVSVHLCYEATDHFVVVNSGIRQIIEGVKFSGMFQLFRN